VRARLRARRAVACWARCEGYALVEVFRLTVARDRDLAVLAAVADLTASRRMSGLLLHGPIPAGLPVPQPIDGILV
jgi:hypothetical protein